MSDKRPRTANYTISEREALFNIISKYKEVIENKLTNAFSVTQKKEAWFKITQEFNSLSPNLVFRTTDSLKKYYENQKLDLKKRAGGGNKSLYTTGGGPPDNFIKDPSDILFVAIVNDKTDYEEERKCSFDKKVSTLEKVYTSKIEKKSKFVPSRRRTTINTKLGKKYEDLIEKRLELIQCYKKEHYLRLQSLELDIALKKKQLEILGHKDSDL